MPTACLILAGPLQWDEETGMRETKTFCGRALVAAVCALLLNLAVAGCGLGRR